MRSASQAQGRQLDPTLRSSESQEFEDSLRQKIVGQEEGVRAVVDLYQVFCAGMCPTGRPVGNLLFLGPTGSGKTRIVEAAAEILFGDPRAVIKVDCAEFQHSHEIAKLIGSPPGYLGHRETHPLITQEELAKYHTEKLKLSFLLFDEIEKASDALWQLLLGMLDKATLTLGDNRRVDLSQTMIFLTSNLGGGEITELMNGGMGFVQPADKPADKLDGKVERTAEDAARAEVFAGIHEPPGQGGGVPSAAARAARADSGDRAGHGAAARAGHGARAVPFPRDAGGARVPAQGRHGPEVRRAAPEAGDRAARGLSRWRTCWPPSRCASATCSASTGTTPTRRLTFREGRRGGGLPMWLPQPGVRKPTRPARRAEAGRSASGDGGREAQLPIPAPPAAPIPAPANRRKIES